MTVASAEAKAGPYTGNDVATTFAFVFKVFSDADIRVVETLISTGVETDLVLNGTNGFTVTKNIDQDNNPGGFITYKQASVTTPLPSTKKLTIVGDYDYNQPTDLPNGGPFFAQTIENSLDRTVMQVKQLKEQVDRSVKVDVSSGQDPAVLIDSLLAAASQAAASAASAAASYDAFDDRWLGAKNSEPALDNDGNALLEGAAYWDTPGKTLKVWSVATSLWYAITAFIQAGAGAISRTWQDKARERISILDYGVASGTDDTTMFSSAIARASAIGGAIVDVPSGTWFTGQITIPSNVKIRLARGTLIKPKAGFALNAFWLVQNGAQDVEITGGSFEVDRTTFPTTVAVYVDTAKWVTLSDIRMPKSGSIGVYVSNSEDVLIERVKSLLVAGRNIQIDGASSARCRVVKCYVSASGGVDHGIQFSGGSDHEATGNYATAATIFGISLYNVTRCVATKNTTYNTVREGINVQDGSDNIVSKNICFWDTTTSQDFGISVWGQAANGCNFNIVQGNKIINAGKSGIALASTTTCKYNRVDGNIISNSNRLNLGATNGGGAGVILYGTGAQANDVCENTVYDNIGFLKHGVFEWNSGGTPSNNRIFNNPTTNAAISNVNKSASSVEGFNQTVWQTYTPTITTGSGTITTLGTVTGRYWETDKMVDFYVNVQITTNGTGATDLRATLPFTNSPASTVAHGRESGVSGVALTGTIAGSATTVVIRKYDNSYPGANSAVIELAGRFVKA